MKPDRQVKLNGRKYNVSGQTTKSVVKTTMGGRQCLKFLVSKKFPINPDEGFRSQIAIQHGTGTQKQSVSFATFFPSKSVKYNSERWGLWQFYPMDDVGEEGRSPSVICYVEKDHLFVMIGWSDEKVNSRKGGVTKYKGHEEFDLGEIPKDKWMDWAVEVNFSFDKNGSLVMEYGDQVFAYTGPNWYNDAKYPVFKCGVYPWTWNDKKNKSEVDLIELGITYPTIKTD